MEIKLNEEPIESIDCLVNRLCDSYTKEEMAYLLQQLKELNHRGSF